MLSVTNEKVDFYFRFLQERHQAFLKAFHDLLEVLSRNEQGAKVEAGKNALAAARLLRDVIPQKDRPQWLQAAIEALQAFDTGQASKDSAPALLMQLVKLYDRVAAHDWSSYLLNDHLAVDFDQIFQNLRADSRLLEYLNKVIDILEHVMGSGLIDSVRVLRTLEKVIATLKSSREGSYLALMGTWSFLLSLGSTRLWDQLGEIAGFGGSMKTLRQALDDTQREIEDIHRRMKEELEVKFGIEIEFGGYVRTEAIARVQNDRGLVGRMKKNA